MVYAFDPTNPVAPDGRMVYDIDTHAEFGAKPIERVAYFLHLVDSEENTRWVYVEMDPFTQAYTRIGVPTPDKDATFQQDVANLVVKSSDAALPSGALASGAIEFWSCNYGPEAARKLPGASEEKYDFDDTLMASTNPGYGSLQIHDVASKTTLLAFNNFRAGRDADVGMGNSDGAHPDWTFSKSANTWASGTLMVLVKTAK